MCRVSRLGWRTGFEFLIVVFLEVVWSGRVFVLYIIVVVKGLDCSGLNFVLSFIGYAILGRFFIYLIKWV